MKVQIKGVGYSVPSRVLNNQDLEKMVDTSDKWIVERTGIRERRVTEPGVATSEYSYRASLMALEHAGITPEQLDLIIVGTSTQDMLFPSTACLVQERLGAWNAAAFDMQAGCTGFVYAATVAEKFLSSPAYNNILVIGAEVLSPFIDYKDRGTCIIFGDGAGAVVMGNGSDERYGFLETYLGADGRGAMQVHILGGGTAYPASHETLDKGYHYLRMNGQEVFKFATVTIEKVAKHLLDKTGFSFNDVDLFVPHQANIRIIQAAMRRMNIGPEKTMINIDRYGNTSAATVPIALSEAHREGRLLPGSLVLMIAFGAGLTFGGILMRWGWDTPCSLRLHYAIF